MLLTVLGAGVFLAGLELMVTAVALPSIVVDLASWTELREASWIINGYLLAYVITMPLAGRLADLWGARRLFMGALVVFVVGSALVSAVKDSLDADGRATKKTISAVTDLVTELAEGVRSARAEAAE